LADRWLAFLLWAARRLASAWRAFRFLACALRALLPAEPQWADFLDARLALKLVSHSASSLASSLASSSVVATHPLGAAALAVAAKGARSASEFGARQVARQVSRRVSQQVA
jgi:hypothetical protein